MASVGRQRFEIENRYNPLFSKQIQSVLISRMKSLKIILLCILSAIAYGILFDQVTARICVEYFTVGHPPIFNTTSPTLLAVGWGVVATWWVGLILGILAALASRCGSLPKFDAIHLVRPIGILLAIMAITSLAAGLIGYQIATIGGLTLSNSFAIRIPREHHPLFFADAFAHLAAYGVGGLGGMLLCIWVWFRRRQSNKTSSVLNKTGTTNRSCIGL
jgi:hypothetical protein